MKTVSGEKELALPYKLQRKIESYSPVQREFNQNCDIGTGPHECNLLICMILLVRIPPRKCATFPESFLATFGVKYTKNMR